MARRRGPDDIDVLCRTWARTRREVMGLREPLRASQYLGSVRSTLSSVRDHRGGGVAPTTSTQFYPEVYTGDAALVNYLFHRMPPHLQAIMDLHYVVEEPIDKRARADFAGIPLRVYWSNLGLAKQRVAGALSIVESVRTQSA
jgi:hypothetical protein